MTYYFIIVFEDTFALINYVRMYCMYRSLTGLLGFSARLAHMEADANYTCSNYDCC